jgi:hypothetical protein
MRIANHLRSHVVAYLALFFALSGTSFAAVQALPRNSVGTRQLKNNAVNSAKVKNNSLTGADIRESSLGKVPSAARADNASHANSADTATNAGSATNASNAASATNAGHASNADKAADANSLQGHPASDFVTTGTLVRFHVLMRPGDPDQVIDQNGALSIVAHCDPTGPEADLFIRTTLDHTTMDAWDQNNDFGPADTTINWGPQNNGPNSYEANVGDGVAVAPDGSVIMIVSIATGYDIGSAPGQCIFLGAHLHG